MPNDDRKAALLEKGSRKLQTVLNDPRSVEMNRMVDIAIQELAYNPRSIKRFVNTARLLYTVWAGPGRPHDPDVDPLILIVHAAHLLLNWPDIASWLQGLPVPQPNNADNGEDDKPTIYRELNDMVLNADEFDAWCKSVQERFGDNGMVLKNAAFYEFVKRVADTREHLGVVFGAGLL